ncbi:MAG: EAL domain-containing protein [Spongiibacteraceae bacterium]|nr:EAL domain-containing protein [Spongiibacteraceae bacterium]
MESPDSILDLQERPIILLVEDNPVERHRVSKILRNTDFEVIAVDCGEVVLEMVIDNQPDLILLDALLPDIDGFEVCQRIRAHPKGLYIPIVMLTGLDDMRSINRAYDAGATDFFTKPINHTLLIHRIRYSLRARKVMDQLRISKQSLVSAQQAAKLGHWEMDIDRQRFRMSDEMIRLYRLEKEFTEGEIDSSLLLRRCHPDDFQALTEFIQASVEEGKDSRIEHRIVFEDGEILYLEVHATLMPDAGNGANHLLGISVDITDRKNAEREILRLAYCDRLTKLPNRSLLELHLDNVIPRAHISGNAVVILAIDLDLFNRVNNSMGHRAGDAVLQQLSKRLEGLLDCADISEYIDHLSMMANDSLIEITNDMVARLTADTFVIVLNVVERESNKVRHFAESVQTLFKQPFIYRGQELFVTASIGVAYSESGSTLAETMLQHADLALHEAKMQGRNTIKEFSGDLVAKISTHLAIQNDLRKAVNNGELQLVYQPKIGISDGSIRGFEALVRWRHPRKGFILPSQFITVAEDTGQIVEIGQWVLETACKQNREWLKRQLVDVRVAVNVSARQFKEGNLIDVIDLALKQSGLSEKNLELEITEGVLISDPNAEKTISDLRQRGITISLDDFGTGYSSLSYITRFPIDTIKIDRCFVQDITLDSDQAVIVSAVSSLSHGLNFNVVAEGVETQKELDVIKQLRCDEVQGYFFYRPMPASEISEWLQHRQLGRASSSHSLGH